MKYLVNLGHRGSWLVRLFQETEVHLQVTAAVLEKSPPVVLTGSRVHWYQSEAFILLLVHKDQHCYACLKTSVLTSFTVVAVLSIHKNTVISKTRGFFAKHFTNYTLFTNPNDLCFYTGIKGQLYLTGYVYYVTWLDKLEKLNLQVLKSLKNITIGITQILTFLVFFCIQLIFLQKDHCLSCCLLAAIQKHAYYFHYKF